MGGGGWGRGNRFNTLATFSFCLLHSISYFFHLMTPQMVTCHAEIHLGYKVILS